ncbi:MAG: DUF4973 domain-containing protein [Dysgonamonadaceae bacterium]|jgi:hypothetical protein|nr:DUF4973 domain-containing protein [Dysgonamonadaceae bacterium]
MKKIFYIFISAIVLTAFYSCQDDWTEEQYEKYVSFVRHGYTETYLNSNVPDGVIHYKIPIVISGSTINDRNVTITVELDPDTLRQYNIDQFYTTRSDLWYRQLDEEYYNFPNGKTVTIPAGKDIGYLDVDFMLNDLDLVEKYILPLKIVSTSEYTPTPKWYKKTLMRIIPFNYFSGTYSANAATITAEGDNTPAAMATREMRVVNDSAVFFYAGLCEENARNRALYKVRTKFNADNTISFTADSAQIQFTPVPGKCTWTIEEKMDALQPYLMIRTLTMDLQYSYMDLTNPDYPVKYNLTGFYTMERRKNTQIPDDQQQEIFEW